MFNYQPSLEEEDYIDIDPRQDWVHISELEKYEDAETHIKEIVNQFYNIGNINALENALDELTSIFEIKLPNKKPKLVKRHDDLCEYRTQFNHSLARLSKIGE